jgi:DNA-binding NarL/FixJ family response regulator
MTRPSRIRRALVVEDLPDTRDWLVDLLHDAFPGIAVETAATLRAGLDWAARRAGCPRLHPAGDAAPTLVLVDLGLPDGSGVALLRALAGRPHDVLPVVTTIYDDDAHLLEALAAGARGYLLKDQEAPALVHQLRRIEDGAPPLSPAIARRILDHFSAGAVAAASGGGPALTPRETDVLRLIGRGLRVAETARHLGIADDTVAGYVKAIYRKLDIASRAEAALEAARRGLV